MTPQRFVSSRIAAVPPSGIRKFFDIVSTMPGAISLGVGEPDFVTPYYIRNAAVMSLEDGETQYTSNWGVEPLRKEIAQYLEERYGLSYDPMNEILVTVGASEAIDLALRATINPGDEVLIPDPSYVSYSPGVIFAGGVAIPVKTLAQDAFRLTESALEAAVSPRTKALILPYPNNPTGAVMNKEDLIAVQRVAEKHDLLVISDEIYSELTYSGKHSSIGALPGMKERTITINGFSKAFAMTGWRIGYLCAPKEIMKVCYRVHQYTIMCAPRPSQVAALEALKRGREHGFEEVTHMIESYNRRRRLMLDAFERMGLDCFEPRGAFYVFPSIQKTGLDSETFCERLLRERSVACVPGTAFGACGEGHIRCCYATAMEKLVEALDRIASFVQGLIKE